MKFFIPRVPAAEEEGAYEGLAASCHSSVPSQDRRIHSITYRHDGDKWTATVGEQLRGKRFRQRRRNRQLIESVVDLSDPAEVLAIFAGDPYLVVTDSGLSANERSRWVNPFMAGVPVSVTYFDRTQQQGHYVPASWLAL